MISKQHGEPGAVAFSRWASVSVDLIVAEILRPDAKANEERYPPPSDLAL